MTKQEIKQLIAGHCINDRAADIIVNKLHEVLEKSYMKWIPIDPDNLPKGEVLAINFDPAASGYKEALVGHLRQEKGTHVTCVICEDNWQVVSGCTHYTDVNKLKWWLGKKFSYNN